MMNDVVRDTPSSISAASIAYALFRAATREKYRNFFNAKEKALFEHMAKSAIATFPDTQMGLTLKKVVMETHKEQRKFFSRNIVPCYDDSFMLRKMMVRHQMEQAIAQGATQVVILGGGYDIRGLISAAAYRSVSFYELDRGPTQTAKMTAIKSIPPELMPLDIQEISLEISQINSNYYALNCDLNKETIETILMPLGFDPKMQTFVVAEGLSAYLDKESNVRLLQTVRHLFQHEQSEFLISYIERLNCLDGLAEEAHKEHKELHLFALPRKDVLHFVQENQLAVSARKTPTDLLAAIHKKEFADHYKNVSKAVEHYYLIRTQNALHCHEDIDAVPELDIPIPFHSQSAGVNPVPGF